MGFMRKARGAISIFLVIIMLPMMTLAGVFLDASRIKLAQEVVTTSGDLALSTVLSNYDTKLKDYFGLLASCQNNADVIAVSKQYFVDNMVSTGVSLSDAQEYADNVIDAFIGDEDITDMLRISVEGDVKIEPTKDGAMNNPALVKKGIIEFMKYRTPVNGAVELFEKIADSDVSDMVENASKEAEMTEAKKKYYEKEEKLIEKAEEAYEATKKYNNYKTKKGNKISDEEYLHTLAKFLEDPNGSGEDFETLFKHAHEKMVKDLYTTHDAEGNLINLLKEKSIAGPGSITTYSDTKMATASNIESLLKSFNTALKEYKTAESELNTAWNKVGKKLGTDYSIQYWAALSNTCSTKYSSYVTKAQALWKAGAKLQNATNYPEEGALETLIKKSSVSNSNVSYDTPDGDGKLSLQSLCDSFFNYYNSTFLHTVTGGGSGAFKSITAEAKKVNTSANRKLIEIGTVDYIYNIRNKLNDYKTDFESSYELAKTAKDKTDKLKKLLKECKEAFADWKTAATDPELKDSQLAQADIAEIEEIEKNGNDLFSENAVIEMTERLGNIHEAQKTFYNDIKGIKYKSTSVTDISKYSKFRNAANLNTSKIVRTEKTLNEYVGKSFSFTIGEEIQRVEIRDNRTSEELVVDGCYVITDSFHFNIEKTQLDLYDWMKEKFDGTPSKDSVTTTLTGKVDDKKSAKNAKKTVKDNSEDVSDVEDEGNIEAKNFKDFPGATLPSKGKSKTDDKKLEGALENNASYVADLFSNFPKTVAGSLANIRDDLYAMDYIFSMFTYDTFDYEGCYAELSESEQKALKASTAKETYKTVEEKWKASEEKKTLTLTPRDATNNWAYGGEVEYILYGKNTDKSNKASAYASIYAIRYVMDLPAVFNTYWEDIPLNTLANTLQALAYIPAPLTKTLACLAITAAEAAIDVSQIRVGMPVMLIKIEEDDLICNYQSVFDGKDESPTDVTDKITLQYSDYLKIFLYVKMVGSGEKDVYVRTADVIQANMYHVTKDKTYSLAKSQVYYDLKATTMVEPMWTRLLAIDDLGDVTTQSAWRTITIDMTRGY